MLILGVYDWVSESDDIEVTKAKCGEREVFVSANS
jgi:hypothetical protein